MLGLGDYYLNEDQTKMKSACQNVTENIMNTPYYQTIFCKTVQKV